MLTIDDQPKSKLRIAVMIENYRNHNWERIANPGLPGFGGYPGKRWTQVSNLEEVASGSLHPRFTCAALGLAQPRWGWIACPSFPRVAAKARQPWALGRNRFAVKNLIRLS